MLFIEPDANEPELSNELELFWLAPSEIVYKTKASVLVAPLNKVVVLPDIKV